jgi:hypothetical protein
MGSRYDAWNYLQTGQSATKGPIAGGTVAMEYEEVDASQCADLIYTEGGKLPLSAANSMNYLVSCLAQPNSYVAKNHVLYNICDAICTLGHDEKCSLDLAVSNQPSCPHTLGLTTALTSAPVYDVQYQSGKLVVAGTGAAAPADVKVDPQPNKSGPVNQAPSQSTGGTKASGAIFIESNPAPTPTTTATILHTQTISLAEAVSSSTSTASTPTAKSPSNSIAADISGSSTLSIVTRPTSQSTTSSSSPTVTRTSTNGAEAARAPVLALAFGLLISWIIGIS